MQKAKFWLIQLLTVAFVTVVLGSPVMAHGDSHKSYKKSYKHWKHKIYKKYKNQNPENGIRSCTVNLERKISRQDRKIEKYENKIEKVSSLDQNKRSVKKRMKRLEKKVSLGFKKKRAWYQKKLDRHNAKHHGMNWWDRTACGGGTACETGGTGEPPSD